MTTAIPGDFYITFDANAREPYTIRRKNEDELNFNLTFGFKAAAGRVAPRRDR